jgi:uncharacterized protein
VDNRLVGVRDEGRDDDAEADRAIAAGVKPRSRRRNGGRMAIPPAGLCYGAPMDRDTVISRLKAHEAELRRLGVQHLWLFGSTARGDARPDSDVDLFFDHEWGKLSLFDIMEVQDVAARILGCDTDVVTRSSLHPVLRDRIENSALLVF